MPEMDQIVPVPREDEDEDDGAEEEATEKVGTECKPGADSEEGEDEKVLKFLDSFDAYLVLIDSLSSALRQGWLELACARHSMGSSRISSALFDHKVQSAATTLKVTDSLDSSLSEPNPHFILSKWGTREDKCSSEEIELDSMQKKSNQSQLRHRAASNILGEREESNSSGNGPQLSFSKDVQKERAKSLAVFGTLVSPKLRTAQSSFETALERIVEMANARSDMLSAFTQLQLEVKGSEDTTREDTV
ncbi:Coiled-coil domain-containing protein 115 [Ananas comosus]|uniref:Vacuolar ATPase assembly protein VMA22 n=1 Tax=Ananas comosus TaxID=4615 RepID=A0A199VEG7_ANACO|nr:Coiled-coil domain-containing protein 115 [Ananas comosus]